MALSRCWLLFVATLLGLACSVHVWANRIELNNNTCLTSNRQRKHFILHYFFWYTRDCRLLVSKEPFTSADFAKPLAATPKCFVRPDVVELFRWSETELALLRRDRASFQEWKLQIFNVKVELLEKPSTTVDLLKTYVPEYKIDFPNVRPVKCYRNYIAQNDQNLSFQCIHYDNITTIMTEQAVSHDYSSNKFSATVVRYNKIPTTAYKIWNEPLRPYINVDRTGSDVLVEELIYGQYSEPNHMALLDLQLIRDNDAGHSSFRVHAKAGETIHLPFADDGGKTMVICKANEECAILYTAYDSTINGVDWCFAYASQYELIGVAGEPKPKQKN